MKIGRSEVLEELGRGGMGAVHRAVDPQDGRAVAIKVLTLGREATDPQRRRFSREARALAKVEHGNVVRLLDTGEHQGSPYLVLDYHAEGSLQAALDRGGPLPVQVVVRVGMALASGLEAIHAQGVLHRDLKPDNILFTSNYDALITDFGLVKDLGREGETEGLTQQGALMGTPGFWAPEQIGGRADTGTDVYGLGATLYAALTGRPPIVRETFVEVIVATRAEVPPSIRSLRPDVPAELVAIVMRCLEKEPGARWASATELREALRSCFLSFGLEPVDASESGSPKRAIAGAIAVLAVVLLAAFVWRSSSAGLPTASDPRAPVVDVPAPQPSEVQPAPKAPRAERALGLSPDGYVRRGNERYANGDYDGAIADHTKAIEISPSYGVAYSNRGAAKRRKGDNSGALADYSKALELDPRDIAASFNRGVARYDAGDDAGAIEDLDLVIEINPKDAGAFHARGKARGRLQSGSSAALSDFSRTIELNPQHVEAYYCRGLVKLARKDLGGAIDDFTKAIEINVRYARAYAARADAAWKLRRDPGAADDYTKAIELDPQLTAAYSGRGAIRLNRRDHEGAIADFSKVIELEPRNARAHLSRGIVNRALGKHPEAVADFQKGLSLDSRVKLPASIRAYMKERAKSQ